MTSPQTSPVADEVTRRQWLILAILLISVFAVVLDTSILNVALKTMAAPRPTGLGASQSALEWALNSYTLVYAGLLLTAGALSDRFGRKKIMLIGMVIFGLCSGLSAASGNSGELIAYRSLMGLGGALITPATLAILMNVFPAASRARAIGIWSGVVGLAIAAGPIVGGALLQQFWWGSVFLVNVPLAIIAVILMIIYIPESKNPKPGRYDLGGVLLSIAGLVILVYGIIKGGEYANFSKPEAWGCILGGIVLIAAWVVNEHRSTHPEFDVRYFRNRRFSASITAIAVMAFGLNGVVFFYVFYTQSIRGYSPLQSGLILLALAAAQMFFAPRARHTVARFGPRLTCAGALAVMAISFLGFLLLGQSTPIWVLVVLLFIMGIGTAHVLPPATVMVMAALPQEKAGSGSAINNAFRQVGAAVGVAVLGSLLSYVYRRGVDGHLTALPAGTRSIADQSIEATISIVHSPPVVRAAESAFINAMHIAAIAAAIVAFLGSAVALAFLPPKPRTEQRSQDAANAEPVKAK